jgi:hypothetical protein
MAGDTEALLADFVLRDERKAAMSGCKKLALIAVGAMATFVPDLVQASPLTEPPFVTFFSQNGSGNGWRRSTGYLMTFVHWNQKGPEWSVENISWVERWSGGGGGLTRIEIDPKTGEEITVDDTVPPWKPPVRVPEPGTVALVGAFVGTLALRRRVKA